MDPTATLTLIIDSLETAPGDSPGDRERQRAEVWEALGDLTEWLQRGGALPDVEAALAAAGYIAEEA